MSVGLIMFQSDWLQCDLDTGWFVKNFANAFPYYVIRNYKHYLHVHLENVQYHTAGRLEGLDQTCCYVRFFTESEEIEPRFKAFWCCQCHAAGQLCFFARDRVEGVQIHQTVSIFEQCWMYANDNVSEELYVYSRASSHAIRLCFSWWQLALIRTTTSAADITVSDSDSVWVNPARDSNLRLRLSLQVQQLWWIFQ